MLKIKGLRRRWLINTVGVVCSLGLVCVMIVTAVFAAYYYSAMESDMRYRAKTTAEFFAEYLNQSYNDYYQSCIAYAQSFVDKDNLELQFIDANGRIVTSSYGSWAGRSPTTPEIADAISSRGPQKYSGKNDDGSLICNGALPQLDDRVENQHADADADACESVFDDG